MNLELTEEGKRMAAGLGQAKQFSLEQRLVNLGNRVEEKLLEFDSALRRFDDELARFGFKLGDMQKLLKPTKEPKPKLHPKGELLVYEDGSIAIKGSICLWDGDRQVKAIVACIKLEDYAIEVEEGQGL